MNSKLKVWLLCGGAAVLGCAHFQPQPLAPEHSAAAFDSRRLDDPGLQKYLAGNDGAAGPQGPRTTWNLNSLTLAAFYFHPSLAVARAQWAVAQAGVATAGARPNPSVSVSPGYDTQIPNNPSPWIIPVTFDVPLETAGKRGKRLAEAEQAAESARWGFVSTAWQIRGEVRASLLELSLAQRRAALLEKQAGIQGKIVQSLRGRLEAGAIARPELALEEIALQKTRLDLNDARARETDARSRLAAAVGVSLAALDGLNLEFDYAAGGPELLTVTSARGVALRERADIRGALADYAAAEADLRLQVAKQYPDLHVGPGYAWNNGNAGDNEWVLGVTLELPILDQNQGPIAEAEARRKLAAAKFLALQAQVCAEIDRTVAGVRLARAQREAAGKLLAAEREQEKSAGAQLEAGAGERLDWLNAQMETGNAALTQLDTEERLQSAIGALEDALQQPADTLAVAIKNLSSNL